MEYSRLILNFDKPIPTKSGRRVSDIWHELLEKRQDMKTAELNNDEDTRVLSAIRINELEDDLGLMITPFPFLSEPETDR